MSHMTTSQSPTSVASIIAKLTNDESTAVVICTPVYSDGPGTFKKALGDGSSKSTIAGVVIDQSVPAGKSGSVLRVGVVTATTAQWDAVCGTSGGLTYGVIYYLSTTVAGVLTTSSASGKPIIFGLGPTVGAIVTASSGSGGITNGAGANVVMKSDGTNAVASGLTDDGSIMSFGSRKFQVGATPVPTQNIMFISSTDTTKTTSVWNTIDSVGHVGFGGNNESIPLVLRNNATHAMGVGGTATAGGLDVAVGTGKASGTGTLTAVAIVAAATGADNNIALQCTHGVITTVDDGSSLAGTTITKLTVSGALADFSSTTAIKLNQNITSPKNTIPGDAANTPQLSLGVTTVNDGTGLQIKNTNATQTLSGIDLLADTTVAANQSTGLFMTRGSGGGGGANGAHPSGLALIGNAGSIVVGTAQGDLALFNQLTGGAIVFGADASAFGFQCRLAQDGGFQFKNYYGSGGERLSASGAASVVLGNTYATGAGTNLTLASGNFDGQVKTFTATSGTGQVTPGAFGNGTKMTWSAGGQSCTFHWDATGAKWWLVSNVGMTVV